MKQLLSLILFQILVFIIPACSSSNERIGTNATGENAFAYVTLSGSVKRYGTVRINRTFRKESIQEAGHGWRKETASPQSFTLERVVAGTTNSWTIRFKEMTNDNWRGMFFENGDHIRVHTIYF